MLESFENGLYCQVNPDRAGGREFEDFFNLLQEEEFLTGVCDWPDFGKVEHSGFSKIWVFFDVLRDTVLQLRVVHTEVDQLVKWEKPFLEEVNMFSFQRTLESINDRTKDFQQF